MTKRIVSNPAARRDYEVLEVYEAGIELKGAEVKSLRNHRANLKGSFARLKGDEVFISGFQITPYDKSGNYLPDPKRERKLLLHKKEILKLVSKTSERGFTLIPLSLYFKRGMAKVELALCKGKRMYDKRESLKRKTHEIEMKRALRHKDR
ncbi:MAG: SsrA-binding protein SmpB [Candidatus Omnitrophica bacterium]|nr:SsrA-binding protein SmpB [Candidatus Omnitrophota bacterium]